MTLEVLELSSRGLVATVSGWWNVPDGAEVRQEGILCGHDEMEDAKEKTDGEIEGWERRGRELESAGEKKLGIGGPPDFTRSGHGL